LKLFLKWSASSFWGLDFKRWALHYEQRNFFASVSFLDCGTALSGEAWLSSCCAESILIPHLNKGQRDPLPGSVWRCAHLTITIYCVEVQVRTVCTPWKLSCVTAIRVPFNDSEGQCINYKSKTHSIKHLGVSACGIHFLETAKLGDLISKLVFFPPFLFFLSPSSFF
jgi:hypothetical protein